MPEHLLVEIVIDSSKHPLPYYTQLKLYRFAAINPSLEDQDDQAVNTMIADPWCVGDRERRWDVWLGGLGDGEENMAVEDEELGCVVAVL